MTFLSVLIASGGQVILMAVVEAVNFSRKRRLTFLTATHVLIAIGYCLPAFLIALLPETAIEASATAGRETNPWGSGLYILDLAHHLDLSPEIFLKAGVILTGGYLFLLIGYFSAARLVQRPLSDADTGLRGLLTIGLVLGSSGVAAMAVYSAQFTSLENLLNAGLNLRQGLVDVSRGYLQVFAQVGLPAFICLVAAAVRMTGPRRCLIAAVAAIVWSFTALRGLHAGGRLDMAIFLLSPILACIFLLRTRTRTVVLAATGFAIILLFLASVETTFFYNPLGRAGQELSQLFASISGNILFTLAYLGFPYISAAHTLTIVPDPITYRYFTDIPLGILYMLPSFSGVETLPPIILELHVKFLPWIPVDLFSFGYYSLGTIGVLITFAAFGALLAMFDGWLTESTGWLGQALRAAWLFYLPFRLLYADPYATLQSGFGLITGTLAFIALALWSAWQRDNPKGR